MGDPGIGRRAKGTGLGKPGLIDFVGVELLVLAQGDGIHLSTRVYLHGHQPHAILHGKLKPHVK